MKKILNKYGKHIFKTITNENQNKIIRKFIPKGFSLNLITRSIVEDITSYINNKARKILRYRTAKELFEKELELIKISLTLNLCKGDTLLNVNQISM